MRKKEEGNHVEVKAVVTETLATKTAVIYDMGDHRDIEREKRIEQQAMFETLRGLRYDKHIFLDRHDLDGILPQQACCVKTTAVRVRYTVDGQAYERETVLSGTGNPCRAGQKIYLTVDPDRPDEILKASLYKSPSLGSVLLFYGMLALLLIFSAVMLYRYQV